MNTLDKKYDPIQEFIAAKQLKITAVTFENDLINITLNTNQLLIDSLLKYPRLSTAKSVDRDNFLLIAQGTGIHWPTLDEDLSLYGFMKDYLNTSFTGNATIKIL